MLSKKYIVIVFLLFIAMGYTQKKELRNASMITTASYMKEVVPLRYKKLIPAQSRKGIVNPKSWGANKVVPGKGLPKGEDPLLSKQKRVTTYRNRKAPSLTFETGTTPSDPSDPTGAIGPNHYVSALNSEFAIHDRNGNILMGPSSLANIWEGETLGDPIVFYDNFADRFIITQFDGTVNSSNDPDNGFLIAVSKGPDPVNDGWYVYAFRTGNTFPDYPKFSVWSDGYYITTNKDQGTQTENEVIYVIERDKVLLGIEDAKMLGFPLPGSSTNGFYSPASFNAIGNTPPPRGDAKIIYLQDDSWEGVNEDALKLWTINVDWINPGESTIAEAEELNVTNGDINMFDATFDGGSFKNLPQPNGGEALDAQQAVMMHATNYRRFCDYNAVVLNFAVDIDLLADNVSGIRWYELRQNGDNQPWTVYQEGTYTSSDGKSAWCASMAMDVFGNIGMGYTTMGTTANGATEDSFVSIRYTGRLAGDALGTMTVPEETIVIGTGINNSERYGDYAHMTVDPVDDQTFWHIAEYFEDATTEVKNIVGVFKIAEDTTTDVGIVNIEAPADATLTNEETITVTIKNFGTTAQSDIPVSYTINGGSPITEMFAGPISPGKTVSFSFAAKADLTAETSYEITTETNLPSDVTPENDCATKKVKNLLSSDVGVIALLSPTSGSGLTTTQPITMIIYNFGGSPQSDIPVFYTLNGGAAITEVFNGTLASQESVEYTFSVTADLFELGNYDFQLGTTLSGDENTDNDTISSTVVHALCAPTSDCAEFGDGITYFELSNVVNTSILCNTGYEDFSEQVIELDRTPGVYDLIIRAGFASGDVERLSLWIDFNDDNLFDNTTELLLDNQVIDRADTDRSFRITLNNNVPLGMHLLRIRAGDTEVNAGAGLNDACNSMQFGTTHDYTVVIDETQNPGGNNQTALIVSSKPDLENQFLITKVDVNAEKEQRIFVFNILGQLIVSNKVKKDDNNRFVYDLDMSYAKSGVYFVRLGNRKKGNSVKFIVQ